MTHSFPFFFCGFFLLLLAGCAATPVKRSMSPTQFTDSKLARSLEDDIAAIERSEPRGWRNLASLAYRVDGESAETFSTACAHLIRRDPTVFLRRHLAGDTDALFCGWAAYGWAGNYRPILDAVYRHRFLEARSVTERQRIEEFIAFCHDSNKVPPRHRMTLTKRD